MPTIQQLFGTRSNNAHNSVSNYFAKPIGMGIELELENFRYNYIPEELNIHWNIIPDNSLRNDGAELVLNAPKSGKVLVQAIKHLSRFIDNLDVPPTLSHRCSMHCHINVNDLYIDNIDAIYALYALLEPSLYTISSKERYNNIYCPGLTHATDLVSKAGLMSKNENTFYEIINNWPKYTGLNLAPIRRQGSIEIRMHRGTIEQQDILLWVRLLNYIVAYASDKTLEDIVNLGKQGTVETVHSVFPESLVDDILTENLRMYWNNALLNVQYMYVSKEYVEVNDKPSSLTLNKKALNEVFK